LPRTVRLSEIAPPFINAIKKLALVHVQIVTKTQCGRRGHVHPPVTVSHAAVAVVTVIEKLAVVAIAVRELHDA
jgi:hypothetical protein